MISVIIKVTRLTLISGIKYSTKSPSQLVKGPGKTGKKLPIIPRIIKELASMIKKISIGFYMLDSKSVPMLQNLTVC